MNVRPIEDHLGLPSVPNPKFAPFFGTHARELRIRRTLEIYDSRVVCFGNSLNGIVAKNEANFRTTTPG